MSILFLVLASVFAGAPLWAMQLWSIVWEEEQAQIAVDNAAIVLGRGDRALLNELVGVNRKLRALEVEHHVAHHCAQIPSPAKAGCEATDRALELTLRALRLAAYERAQLAWRESEFKAFAEAKRLKNRISIDERSIRPPLRSIRCAECQLDIFWELEEPKRRGFLLRTHGPSPQFSRVVWEGTDLRSGKKWNYRLAPVCRDRRHR